MRHPDVRRKAEELLLRADVRVGGSRPWDIRVHDPGLFVRVAAQGSLGLGESYMDGWWDCEQLDEFFCRVLRAELDKQLTYRDLGLVAAFVKARLLNPQKSRAFHIGEHHYDLGNDLYESMLDRRMTYSCGYWRSADNLDAAQEAKLDLTCRKLRLEPGMTVLDIGCGWGSFARFAAERYGAKVLGITVSKEQVSLAQERCAGLPVEVRLQDYRTVEGAFDRVLSIGMFEHVGHKNYRTYFQVIDRLLRADGLSLLHTIGRNTTAQHGSRDPWIDKYIFPDGELPSMGQITAAAERCFLVEDVHSFGLDYDRTLMAWHQNLSAHWPRLEARYGKRFQRMWTYYLLSCAGGFRARKTQLWQVVFAKEGTTRGYVAERK